MVKDPTTLSPVLVRLEEDEDGGGGAAISLSAVRRFNFFLCCCNAGGFLLVLPGEVRIKTWGQFVPHSHASDDSRARVTTEVKLDESFVDRVGKRGVAGQSR